TGRNAINSGIEDCAVAFDSAALYCCTDSRCVSDTDVRTVDLRIRDHMTTAHLACAEGLRSETYEIEKLVAIKKFRFIDRQKAFRHSHLLRTAKRREFIRQGKLPRRMYNHRTHLMLVEAGSKKARVNVGHRVDALFADMSK